jgi:hypothetical protein
MSRTHKKQTTKSLYGNGQRGHHNTLLREFHGCSIGIVKDSRNLVERRDYRSDRHKKIRLIIGKKRRAYMKRLTNKTISDEIF